MQTITRGKRFIKALVTALTIVSALPAYGEWKVDLSRRQQLTRQDDLRQPASVAEFPKEIQQMDVAAPVLPSPQAEAPGFFQSLFESHEVAQEIVILNTNKGFVPAAVRVKKGLTYKVHVVNVNEQEKNISFVLDSFSEHHSTYYGKMTSFVIKPQKEGVYRFVSPETSAQGKFVVYPAGPENRLPASE